MKVLITGGAGFIGSHLANRLLARKDEVLVIDNYATGRRDNLEPTPGLTIVEGSIADEKLMEQVVSDFGPEVIVHAAASYKDPENWLEDSETNVRGSAIVARTARKAKVRRLIYFQTALCYGLHPIEQPITVNHPIQATESSYAISKTGGESYIMLSGLDFISFRLANAYGPRNLSGPLPTFYQRLSSNKGCFVMDTRRDFIYVQDLVDVVMLAIDGKGSSGVYHISSGADYSIKELFEATLKALDLPADHAVEERPRNPDDAFTILLDPSKTNNDFGWKITTSLETGVREAINWYKEYGITQTYTHLKLGETKQS